MRTSKDLEEYFSLQSSSRGSTYDLNATDQSNSVTDSGPTGSMHARSGPGWSVGGLEEGACLGLRP